MRIWIAVKHSLQIDQSQTRCETIGQVPNFVYGKLLAHTLRIALALYYLLKTGKFGKLMLILACNTGARLRLACLERVYHFSGN